MKTRASESGFILGLLLMVIVLMAAVATFMSVTSSSTSLNLDAERVRSETFNIRNQGSAVRNTFRSLLRRGIPLSTIDFDSACRDAARCLMSVTDSGLSLRPTKEFVFSDAPMGSQAQIDSYSLWLFDKVGRLGTTTSAIAVMRRPLRPEVCFAIESTIRGHAVRDASTLIAFSRLDLVPLTRVIELSAIPTSPDGCGKFTPSLGGAEQYFYFVVLGGY